MSKNNPKIVRAWCFYDWANSVYALTITSAVFPVYYNGLTRAAFGGNTVNFFGFSIENTVLYSYSLSLAFLLVALMSPLLSGMADYGGRKKLFMKLFTYIGGLSCIGLGFFTGDNIEYGILLSISGCVGYAGSLVFYHAFLHEIVTPDRVDYTSAKGFAFGYIGSVILLIINLITIIFWKDFGFPQESLAARVAFMAVGVWWIGFAQITFRGVPENKNHSKNYNQQIFLKGYLELYQVFQKIRAMPSLKTYLMAFFFYSTGVQTVMFLAATFGEKEMQLNDDKLIATVLILQLIAIAGAYLFARLSKIKGNKFALMTMVVIWIGICIYGYFIQTEYQFYGLALFVGTVMGGIQSLFRSTYSKLFPENTSDTASFFSFYDVTEKLSIVLGTFMFGFLEQLTDSMRVSILSLIVFFVIGFGFLNQLKMPHSKKTIP